MGKVLWMVTTRDRYRLPIAVFDTLDELAEFCGQPKKLIKYQIKRQERSGHGSIYIRVELDEDICDDGPGW